MYIIYDIPQSIYIVVLGTFYTYQEYTITFIHHKTPKKESLEPRLAQQNAALVVSQWDPFCLYAFELSGIRLLLVRIGWRKGCTSLENSGAAGLEEFLLIGFPLLFFSGITTSWKQWFGTNKRTTSFFGTSGNNPQVIQFIEAN